MIIHSVYKKRTCFNHAFTIIINIFSTDFERGFIAAEVQKYNDLKELGSEAAVKAAGKYLQKGKDYVVEDGDIMHFKFNVTGNKKK